MAADESDRPGYRELVEELHKAAKSNIMEELEACLAQDVDINAVNLKGLTALHLACREGHSDIVRKLLQRGADIQATTKKQNTPLHVASLGGKLDIVKELIKQGADVNAQAENGMTSLYMAAQENHIEVAKSLLQKEANPHLSASGGFEPVDVAIQQKHPEMTAYLSEYGSKKGLKALHVIARKDDTNAATLLLKNGYDPNVTAPNGYTPLHIAAKYGNVNTALLLIENSAKVDIPAKHKITALHVAAKHGQTAIVSLLIEAGAPLDSATKDGLTPLHCSARDGHKNCVELLIVHNASLTAKTTHGLTALHMAAQGNHVNCANLLLGHGCHIDSPTSEGVTPLHVAAHYGNLNIAQLLCDRGADIDCRARNGYTALHVACKKNREAVVNLLIRYGADVHLRNMNGQTALHLAAFFGMVNIVLILIQNGASTEVTTIREETILHIACRTKQITIVRLLLRNGAKVDPRSMLEETPLLIACRLRCPEIVSVLLDSEADPDTRNKDDSTPLHIAARDGNEAIVESLLDHGASIDLKNKRQCTPLHEAAKGGHSETAFMLLEKNANINAEANNNLRPLHMACHYRRIETATLLVDNGADLQATAKNGYTPLHIASKKNSLELASLLLSKGVDADTTTRSGISALHIAAKEGNVDIIDALLENGASPGIQTKNGLTPLHLAAWYNQIEVAKKLIKYAAPINAQTNSGYTPLHIAAFYGNIEIANLLLQDGADVEAKTRNANTPLHIASLRGYTKLVELLLKYNAPTNTLNKDGYTALYIAEITHQTIIIETLVKVTHVIIKRKKDEKKAAEKLKLAFAAPEELEETQLIEASDESDTEASTERFPIHEDFAETFLGFEESSQTQSVVETSIKVDTTTETVQTYITESPVQTESSAPVFEFSPPGIVLTSEDNKMVENVMSFEPPITGSFLISFLVDARGGSFESTQTGIRVTIPRAACAMPTRITCRLLRSNVTVLPPKLAANEGLVSKIIEIAPQGIQFLKPVTIEVPHFGSLRKRERELIVLRSDPDADFWREHVSTRIHSELNEEDGFAEMPTSPEHGSKSGTQFVRIVTQDFPERFVVVARPRKEKFLMFPEGGVLKSNLLPKAQVIFSENTLNMSTKIVLQVQQMDNSLLQPDETARFSSIIKLEPHMKLMNPVTIVLPCPWITPDQIFGVSPNLRLMALMPDDVKEMGEMSDWSWNDVTEICSLTAIESCCRFQTTFLTTYWLIEHNIPEKAPAKAELLFPKICSLPFLTKFVIFARALTADTAELRVFCATDDRAEHTLERQEGLIEVAKSRDLELYDGQTVHLNFSGNMMPATKSLKMVFRAFKENRLSLKVSALNSLDSWSCTIGFIGSLRPDINGRVGLLCNLDVVLPESFGMQNITSNHSVGYQVSDDLIQKISRNIGDKWTDLALNLNLTEADIQGAIDLSSNHGELATMTLLELWRSSRGDNATYEELRDALEAVGRRDLCELVESRSPTSLSPRSSSSNLNDQKFDEAVNLEGLLISEKSDQDKPDSQFEFPEIDDTKPTDYDKVEVESPHNVISEGIPTDTEMIAESDKLQDDNSNFDELLQNMMEKYPGGDEDSPPCNVEESVQSVIQTHVQESLPEMESSCVNEEADGADNLIESRPQLEACEEDPIAEVKRRAEESEMVFDDKLFGDVTDRYETPAEDSPLSNRECNELPEELPIRESPDGEAPKALEVSLEIETGAGSTRLSDELSVRESPSGESPTPVEVSPDVESLDAESSKLPEESSIRESPSGQSPVVAEESKFRESPVGESSKAVETIAEETLDENRNIGEKGVVVMKSQVSTEITTETRTMINNEVVSEQTTHTTLKSQDDTDIIKQMFAGDQSVMAFFDTPQKVADEVQKEDVEQGITFV